MSCVRACSDFESAIALVLFVLSATGLGAAHEADATSTAENTVSVFQFLLAWGINGWLSVTALFVPVIAGYFSNVLCFPENAGNNGMRKGNLVLACWVEKALKLGPVMEDDGIGKPSALCTCIREKMWDEEWPEEDKSRDAAYDV
ncbi:hypothetical protein NDN08_006965 [Rhodosorus marinus]|uniref:Uncharacterized protein n=1 Tax=Rhodosorus marinus TaxID=101924 RepID=A0AAV8UM09_9RHOD|nr:hypothetical protein NDN08_006965 [Rhodosorus marinus]